MKGNYDSYVKTRAEIEENQMKQYAREQDQIKHMKVSVWYHPVNTTKLSWPNKCCVMAV